MPFSRPSLTDLKSQVAADVQANLQGVTALLRYAVVRVVTIVQAGLAHLHYGYIDWISKQAVPWTATDEYAAGWGALKGVYLKAATEASGAAAFIGTTGTPLPAGTTIVRGDGRTYVTLADTVVDGSGNVTVQAQDTTPGAAGNCDQGTQLSLGTAIPGIQSTGSASTAFTGGADVENAEDFNARIIDAFQNPPQGGDKTDYVTWALAVAGVTRAWCRPNGFGAGTVVVYTMFDDAESAHGGFPQGTNGVSQFDQGPDGLPRDTVATGDQLAVADAIISTQPVTALVYSCAPSQNVVPFTITGLSTASSATKAALEAAIDDVFLRTGDPTGATVALSDIESSIAAIAGTEGFVITSPTGNITSAIGFLPVRGTMTYP
ncbi:baseplate J/gp47 family protein [Paraburkholderia sp. 2C]